MQTVEPSLHCGHSERTDETQRGADPLDGNTQYVEVQGIKPVSQLERV